jgi:hypothetical protein
MNADTKARLDALYETERAALVAIPRAPSKAMADDLAATAAAARAEIEELLAEDAADSHLQVAALHLTAARERRGEVREGENGAALQVALAELRTVSRGTMPTRDAQEADAALRAIATAAGLDGTGSVGEVATRVSALVQQAKP